VLIENSFPFFLPAEKPVKMMLFGGAISCRFPPRFKVTFLCSLDLILLFLLLRWRVCMESNLVYKLEC
jgi:hypothetical protein